jgi:hypothetical protein
MTADPHIEAHNDDTGDAADLLRYYRDGMDTYRQSSIEQTNKADALAARLEAAERDRDRQQERVDYLFRTHPSEWEPEVIRWLSPAVRAGWEGSDDAPKPAGFPHVDPCACGHDHTVGREGVCGTFLCDCRKWTAPEREGGDDA